MFTLPLEKISLKDSSLAGNKAATLGEIGKLGINTPNGFVLLSHAFDYFLSYNNLPLKIFSTLSSIKFENENELEEKSKELVELIIKGKFPPQIQEEILRESSRLALEKIAARSSALAEDSQKNSWAGQFESLINIRKENMFFAIKKVWASSFSAHALQYRRDSGFGEKTFSMAVIIQEFIESESSGIGFSITPNNNEVVLIESGSITKKQITSGIMTPDKYFVSKEKLQIIDASIMKTKNNKNKMLPKDEIETLALHITKLEKYFGYPVDIEWLKNKKEEFYFIQARAITTIKTNSNMNKTHIKIAYKPLLALSAIEAWHLGELPAKYKLEENPADPLFICHLKKGINIYYNKNSIKSQPAELANYYRKNWNFGLRKKTEKFYSACEKLFLLTKNPKEENIPKMLNYLILIWPHLFDITILLLADRKGIPIEKEIIDTLKNARKMSEKISHNAFNFILTHAEKHYSKKTTGKTFYYSDFLSMKELKEEKYKTRFPLILKQVKENNSFVYYRGKIYFGSKAKELAKEKIAENFNSTKINTNTADKNTLLGIPIYPGKVEGTARKISNYYDLSKIKDGDILVAPDISPEYSKIIRKVSGIITEEGGELSHTAILAREYKKPCITEAHGIMKKISDGQKIELDGKEGKIRII